MAWAVGRFVVEPGNVRRFITEVCIVPKYFALIVATYLCAYVATWFSNVVFCGCQSTKSGRDASSPSGMLGWTSKTV